MNFDFDSIKIPVFTGINDNSRIPTASKAGNGSHLIKQFNDLIDLIKNAFSDLKTSSKWIVTDADYIANVGEKIAVRSSLSVTLTLPESPQSGDSVSLVNTNSLTSIYIAGSGIFAGMYNPVVSIDGKQFESVDLIWVDEIMGWIPSKPDILTIIEQAG